jgi:hypothetical protein
MSIRVHRLTFEVHVEIKHHDSGEQTLGRAQGKLKKTVIANRLPLRSFQCRGTLRITPINGLEFIPDKEGKL